MISYFLKKNPSAIPQDYMISSSKQTYTKHLI